MNIVGLRDSVTISKFGGKAANLAYMVRAGLPVPDGFSVGLEGFDESGAIKVEFAQKIREQIDKNKLYAVRSSAVGEDTAGASWAGQFETFLNVQPAEIIEKVEGCHNSAQLRAKIYAEGQTGSNDFRVAVVVQEMISPEYAGVLFTRNPVTGASQLVTEYVSGLGEPLVGGTADPQIANLSSDDKLPFDKSMLIALAAKISELFGGPQDVEWASADGKIWLLQARPITATGKSTRKFDLGEPNELFYWGPSRATPMYTSDFMAGIEQVFKQMNDNSALPNPPEALVLFDEGRMVWLLKAKDFSAFTRATFESYEKQGRLEQDINDWRRACERLPSLPGDEFDKELVSAWKYTEMAEFALYGSENYIAEMLARFDATAAARIWGAFTAPDKIGFMDELDIELAASKNVVAMAKKYPWIRDGYAGPNNEAEWYFEKRLLAVDRDGLVKNEDNVSKRRALAEKFGLSENELRALKFARKLAEFMDERKRWMMQTRRLIKRSLSPIEHGWHYVDGQSSLINKADTHALWQRYVEFKTSDEVLVGAVANNGGKRFLAGEVRVLNSHTDPVESDKILVVPSTSPGWVPLMRHARALITDHGGMLSHAAIVAREFGLPSIVGTKNGTKILKDGDKVVLDLVRGKINL